MPSIVVLPWGVPLPRLLLVWGVFVSLRALVCKCRQCGLPSTAIPEAERTFVFLVREFWTRLLYREYGCGGG